MDDYPAEPAPLYAADDPEPKEKPKSDMNGTENATLGKWDGPGDKPPSKGHVAIAALVRVLLIVMIVLAVWVLVTIKALTNTDAAVWWSLLAGLALFSIDFAFLAKRKGREWHWGWSPAILIYVLVSGAAVMLTVLEYRSLWRANSVFTTNSTITMYGLSSLLLYISYSDLIQLCVGYVLLAAAVGQWMLGREPILSAEPRFNVLLVCMCQATDLAIFCFSLLSCSSSADDTYSIVFVACASLALLQFSFDPAQSWAKPSPSYSQGSGCTKCLSNQFVRAAVPLFLHELPLLVARILLLADAGSLFSACSIPLIYFCVSKNALCFVYLLSWMIMSGCRGCAGEGTSMHNVKSEENDGRRKRKDSANRKRIKASIKMRNKVGTKGGYM